MKIRKAILTGGGRATRLRPLTSTTNKHLINLAGQPMIFHAIRKVVKAGVEEIYINTNPGDTSLEKIIGDGSKFGVKITFFEQTGGPQGIAHVVKQAERFIGDEPFIFYLSDNIILNDINSLIDQYEKEGCHCVLALAKVPDPNRFGVPTIGEDGLIKEVIEKPENPLSDFAVSGIYIYGPKVFFEMFDKIVKSARGEYEISDIHSQLIKHGYKVGHSEITGWWKDTGKPEDLLLANRLLLDEMKDEDFNTPGKILLGEGVEIKDNVKIIGPAIIGDNTVLENCEIGPYTVLGKNNFIKDLDIEDSIIFDTCSLTRKGIKIKSSIIGNNVEMVEDLKKDNCHRILLGDSSFVEF